MSQFLQSAPAPIGATKPIQPGGVLSYKNETKPSAFANEKVQATYGFKSYNNAPPCLGERSGHYSVVVDQPDDKRMGAPILDDIFTPSDPAMAELTEYFLKRLPAEQKSLGAVRTIQQHGLQDLLTRFLRKKLQDDAEEVRARYSGATAVESQLASARLQNRFSDMIRYYGSEQRLREAILRDVVGGQPEAALRASAGAALKREMAEGGAGAFPVDPAAPPGAMPVGGGEAMAEGADATGMMEDGMREREGEAYAEPESPSDQVRRLAQKIDELQAEDDMITDALMETDDSEMIERLEGQKEQISQEIMSLENQIRLLEEQGIDPEKRSNLSELFVDSESGGMGYTPPEPADADGDAVASAYTPVAAMGSAGGYSSERLSRGPGASSSRRLVGEVIGHQAPSAPARAIATADPAAAGATARQDMFSRSRRQQARGALHRAIMGMDMGEEDEPVEVVRQSVPGQEDRRSRRSRR